MRKETSLHYATAVTQYGRIAGSQQWANPEYSLASFGNTGTTISNVLKYPNNSHPFGPGYNWKTTSPYVAAPNDNLSFPNALRYSGFTIDDAGVTSDTIITNLYIMLQYSDETGISNSWYHDGNVSGSNWLAIPVKANGTQLCRKRFDGQRVYPITTRERIPCLKDQSWATNTFGGDISPNGAPKSQSSVSRTLNPISQAVPFGGNRPLIEYYEATNDIQPLTVGDVNNSGFYIDLWYSFEQSQSGLVTIFSVGIIAEYALSNTKSATLWPLNVSPDVAKTVNIPSLNSKSWTNPSKAGVADAITSQNGTSIYTFTDVGGHDVQTLTATSDSYVDVFSRPSGLFQGVGFPYGNFDTDILFTKLPSLNDMGITAPSITDMIIDVRVNGTTDDTGTNTPSVKWTYFLYNGYPTDRFGTTGNGTPIYDHGMVMVDSGIAPVGNTSTGAWQLVWPKITGGYNTAVKEFYGSENNWYMRHYPVLRSDSSYTTEFINSSYYPGIVYDPLWIEKASAAGKLFLGVSLTIDAGTQVYYNTIPNPTWWIRIDSLGLRIKYNTDAGPAAPISSLLYRNTP